MSYNYVRPQGQRQTKIWNYYNNSDKWDWYRISIWPDYLAKAVIEERLSYKLRWQMFLYLVGNGKDPKIAVRDILEMGDSYFDREAIAHVENLPEAVANADGDYDYWDEINKRIEPLTRKTRRQMVYEGVSEKRWKKQQAEMYEKEYQDRILAARGGYDIEKLREADFDIEKLREEEEGKKTQGQLQIHNRLFFGPTAVGKTTMVMKMTMGKGLDLYTKAGWNKWFEGYKKEKHMLVDEFGTGFCDGKIENFNAMNNIGVNVQEVKGSHVLLHVTHAYFTTNKHPLHIWDEVKESGTYKAFIRRFAEVYWWNDKHELVILKNPGPKEEAEDEAKWKKECSRWYSFWNGKQLDDEHRTIVPGQAVKNYFTFGCNQPQTDIRSMF